MKGEGRLITSAAQHLNIIIIARVATGNISEKKASKASFIFFGVFLHFFLCVSLNSVNRFDFSVPFLTVADVLFFFNKLISEFLNDQLELVRGTFFFSRYCFLFFK